jgi:hypothetical protein
MNALRQLLIVRVSPIFQKLRGQQVEKPLVLVSVTSRAWVTTPMVEYTFLVSTKRDMSPNGKNGP